MQPPKYNIEMNRSKKLEKITPQGNADFVLRYTSQFTVNKKNLKTFDLLPESFLNYKINGHFFFSKF